MANFREYIGESPAGVTWIAYKPENVEPMRQRLALLHFAARLRAQRGETSALPAQESPESPTKVMPSLDQEIVKEGPQGPVDLEALDRLRKLCAGRRSQNLWISVGEDGQSRVCTYRSRYEDSAKDVRSLVPAAGGTVQAFFKHGTMGSDMTNKPWVVRFTLGPAETAYVAREIGKRVLRDLLGEN